MKQRSIDNKDIYIIKDNDGTVTVKAKNINGAKEISRVLRKLFKSKDFKNNNQWKQ